MRTQEAKDAAFRKSYKYIGERNLVKALKLETSPGPFDPQNKLDLMHTPIHTESRKIWWKCEVR